MKIFLTPKKILTSISNSHIFKYLDVFSVFLLGMLWIIDRKDDKMDVTVNNTLKRLEDIELEIKELNAKKQVLKEKWESEKLVIQEIRAIKKRIEQTKSDADNYEKIGDLGKVAELRYGTIHQLESKLESANERLNHLQQSGKLLKEEIETEDIAEIVSKWTGIPVSKMMETEISKLLHMEDNLHDRVVGQEEAVTVVSNALRRSRAGLADENRPIGSFIFLGTTGVGKTEMARALAEFLFDDEASMIRIDMSEYMEKHSVSRLIGAPPGYVGYDEGGQLTEAVRRRPYSVLLLDEIEKAHPDVFNVLLQVLDDGRLTDGKGRLVNFKNTIIIMSSNIGTEIIQDKFSILETESRDKVFDNLKQQILALLKTKMRPEFLNRVDDIVIFKPLSKEEIKDVAVLNLRRLEKKLSEKQIKMELSENAMSKLIDLGYDINYGARPLKRTIQKYIADPLAFKLLGAEFSTGDNIFVDLDNNGQFIFTKNVHL